MYLSNQINTPNIGFSGAYQLLQEQLSKSSGDDSRFLGIFTIRAEFDSDIRTVVTKKFIFKDNIGADTLHLGEMKDMSVWRGDDETPPPGPQGNPDYLFQITENFAFPSENDAPRQKIVDYFSPDLASYRKDSSYQLFAGNGIYFFGYQAGDKKIPFIVVQS